MNRLAQLRKEKGYTSVKAAAEAIGMPNTTYRSYEYEEREMRDEVLRRFSDFYGVSIDYILCRTDERQPEDEDEKIMELRQQMRERPEMSFLMDLAKNAKASDILEASALLQRLKEESENK